MSSKDLYLREAAPLLNLQEGTLRVYVGRGQFQFTKDGKGRLMINIKEIERYKHKKKLLSEEIKDHFSLKEIEGMGISRTLVINGEIDSKIIDGKYYIHFKELKRYLKTINKCSKLTSLSCEKEMQVLNRDGLHCRPSAKIIKICNEYMDKGLAVKISHKNEDWLFPSMGIFELLELDVEHLEIIKIHIEGGGSLFCMRDLEEAFKKEFDIKY